MQRFRKNIVAHISAKDNIKTSLRKQSFDGNHHHTIPEFEYGYCKETASSDTRQWSEYRRMKNCPTAEVRGRVAVASSPSGLVDRDQVVPRGLAPSRDRRAWTRRWQRRRWTRWRWWRGGWAGELTRAVRGTSTASECEPVYLAASRALLSNYTLQSHVLPLAWSEKMPLTNCPHQVPGELEF